MQPRSTSGGKLTNLGHRQSTLLRFFTGIHLQQERTHLLYTTILDTVQALEEFWVCRIDRIEYAEDGVVLVRLESTDIPDSQPVTLAQGEDVLANGFLEVVLTDFGRSCINGFQDSGKRLCLRHADNMRFAGLTSRPAIRQTGSLADFGEALSYRAHIRR